MYLQKHLPCHTCIYKLNKHFLAFIPLTDPVMLFQTQTVKIILNKFEITIPWTWYMKTCMYICLLMNYSLIFPIAAGLWRSVTTDVPVMTVATDVPIMMVSHLSAIYIYLNLFGKTQIKVIILNLQDFNWILAKPNQTRWLSGLMRSRVHSLMFIIVSWETGIESWSGQ